MRMSDYIKLPWTHELHLKHTEHHNRTEIFASAGRTPQRGIMRTGKRDLQGSSFRQEGAFGRNEPSGGTSFREKGAFRRKSLWEGKPTGKIDIAETLESPGNPSVPRGILLSKNDIDLPQGHGWGTLRDPEEPTRAYQTCQGSQEPSPSSPPRCSTPAAPQSPHPLQQHAAGPSAGAGETVSRCDLTASRKCTASPLQRLNWQPDHERPAAQVRGLRMRARRRRP